MWRVANCRSNPVMAECLVRIKDPSVAPEICRAIERYSHWQTGDWWFHPNRAGSSEERPSRPNYNMFFFHPKHMLTPYPWEHFISSGNADSQSLCLSATCWLWRARVFIKPAGLAWPSANRLWRSTTLYKSRHTVHTCSSNWWKKGTYWNFQESPRCQPGLWFHALNMCQIENWEVHRNSPSFDLQSCPAIKYWTGIFSQLSGQVEPYVKKCVLISTRLVEERPVL